tara:strand:+ start:164 stop:328 length:165 start_codon:yes stop_codon:yes gene_type:complete
VKKVNSLALKAAKKNKVSNDKKWKVTSKASVAGCSGPWARASDPRWGKDQGVLC